MSNDALRIEYVPTSALIPHPNNPRVHSKQQVLLIAKSFREFGFVNPILADAKNRIIAGHGRVDAAKHEGITAVPVLRIEHLTEHQLRAYVLADNKLAERAGWDREMLAIELQNLLSIDADLDITVTGFDIPEIDVLLGELNNKPAKPDADDVLPAPGVAVAKAGDLWQLGRHRILCSDALDAGSYLTLMAGKLAGAVFTDPPYNVPIDGHASGLGKIRHRDFAMATGEMTEGQFTYFLEQALRHLARHSRPGSLHYVCQDWRHAYELLCAARAVYTELKNICVWAKDCAGMGSQYRSQHEFVFVFKHGTARHRNNVELGKHGRNRSNVWNYPSVSAFGRHSEEGRLLELHPTIKPTALVADALLDSSARGEVVLDPFLGSGTTLLAAERVGRRCYGIEIDPRYVDLAIRRWQRHCGDIAIHAVTGKRFDEIEAQAGGPNG